MACCVTRTIHTLLACSCFGSSILSPYDLESSNDLESNDHVSKKRIIPSTAVILVSDSFFHTSRAGTNVFDLVRASTTEAACYGIWERKLCKVTPKLNDMLRFIHALEVHDVMVILCLGQHDVLANQHERLGEAVGKLVALVEKYQNKLVIVELFDHSVFSASTEGYATGVSNLNLLWKHEAWTDDALEVVSTSFIRDDHFIEDQMHLNPEGMNMLCSVLRAKLNAFCLPHRCLS